MVLYGWIFLPHQIPIVFGISLFLIKLDSPQILYHEFSKDEQLAALEEEKRILEERKKLKAGVIGSTVDALDGAASLVGSGVGMVGSGIGAGVGLVGSGMSIGVGMVGEWP